MNTEKKIENTENDSSTSEITGDIIIRRAKKEDGESMMALIRELAVYEKAPEEVTVDFDHFIESGFGKNPVWWAFVAEAGNKVIGFALYYIRYSTWKGQRMYLEDLLVNEPWRGKGIGKLLFDRLLEEAKHKNMSGMVWQVLEWNEPAINFYKKYENVSFDKEWTNCSISLNPKAE